MKTKEEATKAGKALKKKLGKQWKIRVWQNMGWHYCCYLGKGFISVYPSFDGDEFHCMLDLTMPFAGDCRWTKDAPYDKDPRKVVSATLRLANKRLSSEGELFQKILLGALPAIS